MMFNIHSLGYRKICWFSIQFDEAFLESLVFYIICSSKFFIGKVNIFPFSFILQSTTNCNAISGVAKKYALLIVCQRIYSLTAE